MNYIVFTFGEVKMSFLCDIMVTADGSFFNTCILPNTKLTILY